MNLLIEKYQRDDIQGDPDDQKLADQDKDSYREYQKALAGLLERSRASDSSQVYAIVFESIGGNAKKTTDDIDAHMAYDIEQGARLIKANDDAFRTTMWVLSVIVGIAIVATFWNGLRLYVIVAGGLRRMTVKLKTVGDTLDLTRKA